MPSKHKQPWEAYPSLWKTQAAFFTYLRGQLRLVWSKYPAKLLWKKSQMSAPPTGYVGRAKSLGTCHYCGSQFAASHLEVDHVAQAGSCNDWDTAQEFLHNLLDCNDNWVLACKPCHKVKSYAERMGTSFETALIEKKVIDFLKKDRQEVLEFCMAKGYTEAMLKNASQRRAAVTTILSKETQ